jgi:ribosomal protein S12 methylthiotransferase
MTRPRKRFYLLSLGCPKNEVDAENLAGFLGEGGLTRTTDPAQADVLLVNTCGFVQDATQESIDAVLELAGGRKPGQRLVVTGCLYQRYGADLARELPEVDAFVGTGAVEHVLEAVRGQGREFHQGSVFLARHGEPRQRLGVRHYAYLKISDGCNRRCAFCAIPLFKGRQESREVASLADEARDLAQGGAAELILVSQDTAAWGSDLPVPQELPVLLDALDAVPGYRWLRLLYLYPDRVSDELLARFNEHPRLVPYFDIPLQHASDAVLKRMGRGTTRRSLEALIQSIREQVPGAVLRTSLIAGFPGESDAEFQELLDFVEEQQLDNLGVFAFSEEEGTAAAAMEGQVPMEERQARRDEVMRLQAEVSADKLAQRVGQRLEVLVDGRDEEGRQVGRFYGQAPEVDGVVVLNARDGRGLEPGRLLRARVTDASEYDLEAEVEG